MGKLEKLERDSKEVALDLHYFLIQDLADILNTAPERLILVVDIWGHGDAVVPVYRLYNLIPGTETRQAEQIILFSADTLVELKDKAEEFAEYQKKKEGHLS